MEVTKIDTQPVCRCATLPTGGQGDARSVHDRLCHRVVAPLRELRRRLEGRPHFSPPAELRRRVPELLPPRLQRPSVTSLATYRHSVTLPLATPLSTILKDTVRSLIVNHQGTKIMFIIENFILSELDSIQILSKNEIGTRRLVHNKRP